MLRKAYLGIVVLFLFFCSIQISFADSDFENDYTLIDCINGDDTTGVAFDSELPYQTLKGGIEKTIENINENVNLLGNENTASGKVFNIKVKCSANQIKYDHIRLNFDGLRFNNDLIIEGIGENSFVIDGKYFTSSISYRINNRNVYVNGSNITLKKAKFLNAPTNIKSYFFIFSGVKIIDSYIDLGFGDNIIYKGLYKSSYNYKLYPFYYNKISIENSIINFDIKGDFEFGLTTKIKDSKINFKNNDTEQNNQINFYGQLHSFDEYNFFNHSIFISNEIDLGGNDITFSNLDGLAFINNKFSNINKITFPANTVFINNLFENTLDVDISNARYLFNNVFSGIFTDTTDIYNARKNYNIDNIGPKGIAWIYKRDNPGKILDTDTSSYQIYKDITGKEIPQSEDAIYIIYQ